jgi:hypothetical protein
MSVSSFECPICCEFYDDKEFIPATLPCGHSTCRSHLVELPKKECPICRDVFSAELVIRPNIALRDGAVAYSELLKTNREKENQQHKDTTGKNSAITITEQSFTNGSKFPELQHNSNKDSSPWFESVKALFGMKNTQNFQLYEKEIITVMDAQCTQAVQDLKDTSNDVQAAIEEVPAPSESDSLPLKGDSPAESSPVSKAILYEHQPPTVFSYSAPMSTMPLAPQFSSSGNTSLDGIGAAASLFPTPAVPSSLLEVVSSLLPSTVGEPAKAPKPPALAESSTVRDLYQPPVVPLAPSASSSFPSSEVELKSESIDSLDDFMNSIANEPKPSTSGPESSSVATQFFPSGLTPPAKVQCGFLSQSLLSLDSEDYYEEDLLLDCKPSEFDEVETDTLGFYSIRPQQSQDSSTHAVHNVRNNNKVNPFVSNAIVELGAPRSNDNLTTSSDSIYLGPNMIRSHPPLSSENAKVPSVPKTLNAFAKLVDNDYDLRTIERRNTMLTRYEERGLDLNTITSVMNQVNCTRAQAVKALRNNDNDLFLTIMELTTPTAEKAYGTEGKEGKHILPLSTTNSQFWENYYKNVYARDLFSDKAEERTVPLIGKYRCSGTTTGMTARDLFKANPEVSFAKDEKKNCKINDDDFDLISWFEALPPSRIHPTKQVNPSPSHENCKTEFTSASILATGHNNLVRNCVNDCTDANNLKLLEEDVDNNSSTPPQSKGKYLSAPLNTAMGDKEGKKDKRVEMKVNTIGLSW